VKGYSSYLAEHGWMDATRPQFIRAGNSGQGATASAAFLAFAAVWNL
jgi:hypothetical protein